MIYLLVPPIVGASACAIVEQDAVIKSKSFIIMKTIAILALTGAAFVVASCQQQQQQQNVPVDTPPVTITKGKK